MIGEVIKKPGEKGSGGDASAFAPGIHYICFKATKTAMLNIASNEWNDAAKEMRLTSELNNRVQKPYYHLVLSWHEYEQPTDAQMFAAARHMIKHLGLEEHQIVIASHGDTKRSHIHIIVNTVHPITGKVWSKSQDQMKIELACREIELEQGWSHDRGRFDFEVTPKGEVKLTPNPEVWAKKQANREAGKRAKTSGARRFEKTAGIATFENGIPDALKARFAEAVDTNSDWQTLHTALGEIGLRYYTSGSGARVGLLGSKEFAKASAFGSKFSIAKMEKVFGPYEDPKSAYANELKEEHRGIVSISGDVWEEDEKAIASSVFKMTLLRRIYCNIYLDPIVAKAIHYVDLKDPPPQITFKDRSTVVDHGRKITASKSTKETRATMIAMAKAKGWSTVKFTGPPGFVRDAALEAAQAGLPVHDAPADIQAQCDAIIARLQQQQRRIEAEANASLGAVRTTAAEHDLAIEKNNAERAQAAAKVDEMTAEARAVIAALGYCRDPARTALRKVARQEEQRIKANLPDRRNVSKPQPALDGDRDDKGKVRRIADAFRENDHRELDRMREVHIDKIAGIGGWSYDPHHKDGHNDPEGRNRRTYVRNGETIKATRKGTVWVWTNKKSANAGSVIDLWLSDNAGATLGDARRAFRAIMGAATSISKSITTAQRDIEQHDHTDARRRWEEALYINDRHTYAEYCGISKSTLQRFQDQVRLGAFGGIYFAHRNIETGDIQGFEQRWEKNGTKNTARFAKGGIKSVSILGNPDTALRMVLFEGGLDALAFAEIEARDDTIYVSTGGGFGPRTKAAVKRIAKGREVLSAFNNDDAGEALHRTLIGFLPAIQRLVPPSQIDSSKAARKDWLDVLNAKKSKPNYNTPELTSGAVREKEAELASDEPPTVAQEYEADSSAEQPLDAYESPSSPH